MYTYLSVEKVEEMYSLLKNFRKVINHSDVLLPGDGNLDASIKIKSTGYSFCIDTCYYKTPIEFIVNFGNELKELPFDYDINIFMLYRSKDFNMSKFEVEFIRRD